LDRGLITSPATSWRGSAIAIIFSSASLAALINFAALHGQWWLGAAEGIRAWIGAPRIGGPPRAPDHFDLGLTLTVVVLVGGWCWSQIVLHRTELADDKLMRSGLAIVLSVCLLGYLGMVGVATGHLTAWLIWSGAGAWLAAGAVVGWWLMGRRSALHALARPRLRISVGPALAWAAALLVVLLDFMHAMFDPITEWDAVVYHAASAKLWFLEAPAPGVIWGPSPGSQISSNYPPLFPAAGVSMYTAVGSFDDLYLRLLSPILFLALLMMVYAYARCRFGAASARWALLLFAACPLVVLYGAWPTGYMLLACLVFTVVVVGDLFIRTSLTHLCIASGALCGLALLTHFYGLAVLAAAPLALLVFLPGPITLRLRRGAQVICAALLVASPWLVRNFVALRDPIYPYGSPVFRGLGLNGPLWAASTAGIAANGLSYFNGVLPLPFAEVMTLLADKHLLVVGLIPAVVIAITVRQRSSRRAVWYLALVTASVLAVVFTPGWYGLRALLPAVPLAAVVVGYGIDTFRPTWPLGSNNIHLHRAAFALRGAVVALSLPLAIIVSVTLAFLGPNQDTWTTNLSNTDFLRSVSAMGNPRAGEWLAYRGDLLAWEWLNAHIPPKSRLATLEPRIYYLSSATSVLYLDGSEAQSLVGAQDPDTVMRWLASRNVKYVMVPGWKIGKGPAANPAAAILPLSRMLGGPDFPPVAIFASYPHVPPTEIYAVGHYEGPITLGIFPGPDSDVPTGPDGSATIAAGALDAIFEIPEQFPTNLRIEFEFYDGARGTFKIERSVQGQPGQQTIFSARLAGSKTWRKAGLPAETMQGSYALYRILPEGGPVRLRTSRLTPAGD
jgi:hypothetical protein